jgi:sulfide:quinone oxidoreductase
MTGRRSARQITRPLDRLSRKGIEVVHGEVEVIDPVSRRINIKRTLADGGADGVECDYLVVSLGAELAPETIPGLEAAGHNLYTLSGAENLRIALERFSGGRIVVLTATPAYKCPAAPYEAAMLIDGYLQERKLADQSRIDLYAAEPGPLGVAGPEVSAGVRTMVEAKGIGYHPEHQVVTASQSERRLTFANGVTTEFDLLTYVPPHRAPRAVRDAGLIDDSGWVPTDRHTLLTRFPGVYAIGDVTGIPLTMGKPLPKAGVFAEREARVVAHNIVHEITGRGEPVSFDGHGECFIETGGGKAGFGAGNFYAEPVPQITLHRPSRRSHVGKLLFEQNWLRRRV